MSFDKTNIFHVNLGIFECLSRYFNLPIYSWGGKTSSKAAVIIDGTTFN